jgi:predicted small lipoprotein YifL
MARALLTLVIILPLVLGALGCGKKGPPVPPEKRVQAATGVSR